MKSIGNYSKSITNLRNVNSNKKSLFMIYQNQESYLSDGPRFVGIHCGIGTSSERKSTGDFLLYISSVTLCIQGLQIDSLIT